MTPVPTVSEVVSQRVRDIVNLLFECRKRRGISLKEVARRMDVVPSAVSKFESRGDPHLSTILRYAEAIDVRIDIDLIAVQSLKTDQEGWVLEDAESPWPKHLGSV